MSPPKLTGFISTFFMDIFKCKIRCDHAN